MKILLFIETLIVNRYDMKTEFPNIKKESIDTLQINIGYKCNQACKHCHVNSSPSRTEMMSEEILDLIPKIIKKFKIKTLDIIVGINLIISSDIISVLEGLEFTWQCLQA